MRPTSSKVRMLFSTAQPARQRRLGFSNRPDGGALTIDVEGLRRSLRRVRAWRPLNVPVTGACRAAVRRFGWDAGPLIRYLPRVGLVEASLPDGRSLRMWSNADDDVTSAVYWSGWTGHEPETATVFYEHARSATVTLDIGAHVGYFALLAAHANPAGSVYAFEPYPPVYERLSRNVALNGLGNVSCIRLAAGHETGTAPLFHVTADGLPSSSSLSRDFMESIAHPSRLASSEVDVVSIDDFVRKHRVTRVDLVKIDTEATEDTVLEGMVRTLERDRPVLFCEVLEERTARVIEGILTELGYRFFLLREGKPVPCGHVEPRLPWRNYCFIADAGAPGQSATADEVAPERR